METMKGKRNLPTGWAFVLLCLYGAYLFGMSISSALLVAAAVLALPLPFVQDLWKKATGKMKWVKPLVLTALFAVAILIFPQMGPEAEPVPPEKPTVTIEAQITEKLQSDTQKNTDENDDKAFTADFGILEITLDDIPDYSGEAYCVINDNIPFFVVSKEMTESYEFYSELDELGGHDQGALDDQGGADVDLSDLLEIIDGIVIDHLDRGEVSTVVEDDKAKLLAAAAIADPAANFDFLTGVFFGVAEQFSNGDQFHCKDPLFPDTIG